MTDEDVRAIDSCFRGHKTRVFVCGSLANLYTCPRAARADEAPAQSWTLRLTGIPILLLDAGATRSEGVFFFGDLNFKNCFDLGSPQLLEQNLFLFERHFKHQVPN